MKMTRPALLMVFGLALVFTAACAQKMPGTPKPVFSFEKQPALRLDVDTVLFQNQYNEPLAEPYVEHMMPVPPSRAVARWVSTRLQSAGDMGGTLTITVNEASVVKSNLPMTKGVKGWFTMDQSEKYTATVHVTFEAVDAPFGNVSGEVTAKHSMTVPEDASIHEREMAWALMEEKLMEDFDKAAKTLLQDKMPGAMLR